jgi:hypothetical protein
VIVKFFNAMYPFLYYAFAKEYIEGCPERGCIPDLQNYIITFFLTHLAVTLAMVTKRCVFAYLKVRSEITKKCVEDPKEYT